MSRSSTNDFSGVTSDGSMPVTSSMISARPEMISSWLAPISGSFYLFVNPARRNWRAFLYACCALSPSELGEPVQVCGGLDGVRRHSPKFSLRDSDQRSGRRELDDRGDLP